MKDKNNRVNKLARKMASCKFSLVETAAEQTLDDKKIPFYDANNYIIYFLFQDHPT